jgi:hypothetical protein
VAAYKKVGTFRKDGGTKTGGNIATYFCRPDGTVVHVIPGPVSADVFLREARWAVDVHESAVLDHGDDADRQRDYLKLAHATRYLAERRGGNALPRGGKGELVAARLDALMPKTLPRAGGTLGQAHWLLWSEPLPRLSTIYRTVWTDVLNEQVTDAPVRAR